MKEKNKNKKSIVNLLSYDKFSGHMNEAVTANIQKQKLVSQKSTLSHTTSNYFPPDKQHLALENYRQNLKSVQ